MQGVGARPKTRGFGQNYKLTKLERAVTASSWRAHDLALLRENVVVVRERWSNRPGQDRNWDQVPTFMHLQRLPETKSFTILNGR